jgi:hypothetical protein
MLLNRTLIVRDVWVDAKHNPGVFDPELYVLRCDRCHDCDVRFMPFDMFFDFDRLNRGVRCMHIDEFEKVAVCR